MNARNARNTARRLIAGAMKRFLEDISVEMGFGGEINDRVIAEGQKRLNQDGGRGSAQEKGPTSGPSE